MAEIEHTVKVLQLDDSFQEQVKALEAQGWQQVPEIRERLTQEATVDPGGALSPWKESTLKH